MRPPPPRSCVLLSLVLLLTASPAGAKPPALERFFPPGAQRGQTIEVTAEGSFDTWPVRPWVQGRGVELRPAATKGKFTVVVAPDAAVGVAWVRLYNDEDASELRPFVIGTVPEVIEAEPNDAPSAAQGVNTLPVTVNGRLSKNGDVDGYTVTLQAGQTLVAALQAHEALGAPMDAILQVARPDGIVLEQVDDAGGLDPRLVFVAPKRGDYLVRTFAFPSEPSSSIRFAGGEAYLYRLTLTTGAFADHPMPLTVTRNQTGWVGVVGWNLPDEVRTLAVVPTGIEADADRAQADHPMLANPIDVRLVSHRVALERPRIGADSVQLLAAPVSLTGRISAAGERDVYDFRAEKGQVRLLRVASRSLGFPLDPVLRVLDAGGKVVAESDDDRSGRDPEIRFDPPVSGAYRAEVSDLNGRGGPRFVYNLDLLTPEPDARLSIRGTHFTLAPDRPLAIAVVIDRRHGFDAPITITAEGLPPGVSVTPATSGPQGESVRSLNLTLTSNLVTAAWSGSIRIVGRSSSLAGPRFAEIPLDVAGPSVTSAWLTVLQPQVGKIDLGSDAPRQRH